MARKLSAATTSILGDDSRLRKNEASQVRGSRGSADDARKTTDGTILTETERRMYLRNEWMQEALPRPPQLTGFHLIWLTTNSSYDPLAKRLRLGYQLVRKSEVPGFNIDTSQSQVGGEFAEYVTCNEMILAKLPLDVYQEIMAEFHHHMPNDEEERIKEQIKQFTEQQHRNGRRIMEIEGDGYNELLGDNERPVPLFPG